MYIKNRTSLINLARTQEEQETIDFLLKLTEFALEQANPYQILSSSVSTNKEELKVMTKSYKFSDFTNFYLLSFGKASQIMVKWFLDHFPLSFSRIIIVSPDYLVQDADSLEDNISFFKTGHPNPDEMSVEAAETVLSVVQKLTPDDLCFICISGGGSALLESPAFNINLEEYVSLNNLLLSCGATIQEINTIRKHFSKIKGGKLAANTQGRIISFIISDVIGNDPSFIASGPTVLDKTTWSDCKEVFEKYNLSKKVPPIFNQILEGGLQKKFAETPKDKKNFKHVDNFVIGQNSFILQAISDKISNHVEIIDDSLSGEAKDVGKSLVQIISDKTYAKEEIYNPYTIMLFGGETTVTLNSFDGKGGRIQELVLSFILSLEKNENIFFLAFGTDGIDGNSDSAGALVGPFTLVSEEDRKKAQKALLRNDSNTFFKEKGCEIITGYTGTNLMDIGIIIILN